MAVQCAVVQAALRSLVGGWTAETVAGIDEAAVPLAHAADALLTAAWLRAIAGDAAPWSPAPLSTALAATEGWTFGII